MKSKLLLLILAVILGWGWGGAAAAGQIGYSLKSSETGFGFKPETGTPSSAVMAADALIGRPLGLATTIAGAGTFLLTLPFSASAQSTGDAAWGLVGRPGAWTFVRPLGRGNPDFEERGVFKP
jgi:hypothetical protein